MNPAIYLVAGALIMLFGLMLGFLFAVLISASKNRDEDG